MKISERLLSAGLNLMPAFILIVLAVLIFGCSRRADTGPFGTFFPVPPGVLTIQGEDPSGPSPVPPVAEIYWSQTISERGYAQNSRGQLDTSAEFYQFFNAVRLAPGINYKPRYWILRPDTRRFLKWTEVERLNPEQAAFWVSEGTLEYGEGPLTMIYKNDLINPNNLSIVITDLEEQDLNMSLLADLIREKLIKTDDYAAAVIALKLPFNGDNWKPSLQSRTMEGTSYSGPKPIYIIVSGPKDAVTLFIRRFSDQADRFNIKWQAVTTTQRGTIAPLVISDARIPQSASRSEFNRVVQTNRNIYRRTVRNPKLDLWNIRAGRGDYTAPERIWNLQNMTDSMVNHFGLVADGVKLNPINERLGAFILQHKTETAKSGKNGDWLWQLNINFDMPAGCDISELEAQIRNYRYLMMPDTPSENGTESLPIWRQNEVYIARDLDIGQPALVSGSNTAQVYVVPKDTEQGALQSSIVCFDLIVRVKQQIEIPAWVNDFDDTNGRTHDKTWNFSNFVNNLLKGDSASGIVYTEDELIRIPIVLFDMPFVRNNTRSR